MNACHETRIAGIGLLLGLGTVAAAAESWPSWRGPDGNGAVETREAPAEFSPDKNLKWKAELPGRGCSTPVVVDGKIFITSPVDKEDGVLAFDLAGNELWRETLGPLEPGAGQRVGSSANSSPATDGERIFTYFKSGNFAAFDLSGNVLWKTNLFERFGENTLWWDVGTSPVIAGDYVVVAVMQTEGDSYLAAFERDSGELAWKTDRNFETGVESGDAYTTPLVRELDGVPTLVTWGADHLTGHAVDDGRLLWTCGGFNPEKKRAWRVIASAVATDDVAVVPFDRGAQIAGVKLGGEGDITDSAFLWKKSFGADAATPVIHDGRVIVLSDSGRDRGEVKCFDVQTGEEKWASSLPAGAQIYYSSPLVVGDRLYCGREDGVIFSAEIGADGLRDVRENPIGENLIASPAVVEDMLLIRGDRHLMAFAAE
jgi:outer membrane protein assembly factor BamB